jgi:hypothetical protein
MEQIRGAGTKLEGEVAANSQQLEEKVAALQQQLAEVKTTCLTTTHTLQGYTEGEVSKIWTYLQSHDSSLDNLTKAMTPPPGGGPEGHQPALSHIQEVQENLVGRVAKLEEVTRDQGEIVQ